MLNTTKLQVRIPGSVGILDGSGVSGIQAYPLTGELLKMLTDTERGYLAGTLACVVEHNSIYNIRRLAAQPAPLEMPTSVVTDTTVIAALRAHFAPFEAHEIAVADAHHRVAVKTIAAVLAAKNTITESSDARPGRRWMATYAGGTSDVRGSIAFVTDPDPTEALARIDADIAEAAARNAADLAAYKSSVRQAALAWCALPVEERLRQDETGTWHGTMPMDGVSDCGLDDDEFRRVHDIEYSTMSVAHHRNGEARQAQEAAEAQARKSTKDALIAFARTIPSLARGATDGYDGVDTAAMTYIVKSLAEETSGTEVIRHVSTGQWKERNAPNEASFSMRDFVAERACRMALPEGWTVIRLMPGEKPDATKNAVWILPVSRSHRDGNKTVIVAVFTAYGRDPIAIEFAVEE